MADFDFRPDADADEWQRISAFIDSLARDPDYVTVRTAAADKDAEWQRVNSYIADILKDCYVLFAKLARVRGDFTGSELGKLDGISGKVRDLGQELAGFSKAFAEGEYSMDKKKQFGDQAGQGGQGGMDFEMPSDFEPTAEDFDFSPEGGEGGEGGESDEGGQGGGEIDFEMPAEDEDEGEGGGKGEGKGGKEESGDEED